jgi:hypothetical protein
MPVSKFSITLALDDPEMELLVEGNATPYDPGVTSGPPECCYPPEGGEVEIENVYATHPGQMRPIKLEVSPLITYLAAWPELEAMVEDALANRPMKAPNLTTRIDR